jgi:hypothetical protein
MEGKSHEMPEGSAMKRPATLRAFGKELGKLIRSDEVLPLAGEGDWGAGGCWILAQALVDFLGPPAELVAVSERRFEDEILVPVSHVVVRYGDLYIDDSGTQTEEELIEGLEDEGYEFPELQEWNQESVADAMRGGTPCDPRARKELLKHLQRHFG